LYGEGSNEEKNVYVDQLKSLKVRWNIQFFVHVQFFD
jgi:hypothetical protein